MRHAVVDVRSEHASAIAAALEREAQKISEGRLKISRASKQNLQPDELARIVPGITHVIVVYAAEETEYETVLTHPTTWDDCAYKSKDGTCHGGMVTEWWREVEEVRAYDYIRVRLEVVDAASGRTVYRSDEYPTPTPEDRFAARGAAEVRSWKDILGVVSSGFGSLPRTSPAGRDAANREPPPYARRVADACLRALRDANLF